MVKVSLLALLIFATSLLSFDIPIGFFQTGGGYENDASFRFNGTNEMLYTSGLQWDTVFTAANENTFSAWFKIPVPIGLFRNIFSGRVDVTNRFFIVINTSRQVRAAFVNGAFSADYTSSTTVGNDSAWHHLLVVRTNTASDTIAVYFDGTKMPMTASITNTGGNYNGWGCDIYIGAEAFGGGQWWFKDHLDHVALWDSDQSANVSEIYNGGVPPDLSTLATPPDLWYKMDIGDNPGSAGGVVDAIGGANTTGSNMDTSNVDKVDFP